MKALISKSLQGLTLLLAVALMAKSSSATTAVLLTDEQLITSSRIILLGEVQAVRAQWDLPRENIHTYVKVLVSKVLKGQIQGSSIVLKQLGGTVGENSTMIFGAPTYKVKDQVLLFLDTASDGTLRIAHLFQGKYDLIDDPAGQPHVERRIDKESVNILGLQESPEITNTAPLSKFSKIIKRVLRGNAEQVAAYDLKYESVPIVEIPPEYVDDQGNGSQPDDVGAQYALFGNRWFEPDSGQPVVYRLNQTGAPIAGGGVTEINQALAAWTNVTTTSIVLQNGGSTTAVGFRQDGTTAISFNDPLNQMSDPVGCSGILAIGGYSSAGGPTIVINGQVFGRIYEGDVVFNNNFQCFLGISANLAEVAAHEIGHSIGFDHSADPAALMYAQAHGNNRGATPGADDISAVSFLYPGSKSPAAANSATFITQSVPVSMSPGQVYSASVTMRNIGTTTWTAGSNYKLGSQNPGDNFTWGPGRIALPSSVSPGSQVTFNFNVTAPSVPGAYNFQWRMVQDGVQWFGDLSPNVAVNVTAAPNSAQFISQSVPASMIARQIYSVSITMKNIGTTTWTAGGLYRLGSQNPGDNFTWGPGRVALPSSVSPGSQVTFTFNATAPAAPGTYNFQWRMVQDGVQWFGDLSPNRVLNVTAAANSAQFISQSVPTAMTPGQRYNVSLTMKNIGTTTWTAAGLYGLGSQNPGDNFTWGPGRVLLPSSVSAGTQVTFSFSVTAPSVPGTYNFQWRMVQDGVQWFGDLSPNLSVSVK